MMPELVLETFSVCLQFTALIVKNCVFSSLYRMSCKWIMKLSPKKTRM
jgi:hypothetical protein